MTRDEIAARLGWTRNDMVDVVEKIVQAAVDAEREACAKVCEEATLKNWFAEDCVALIRERNNL